MAKVNISIPDELLKQLDEYADSNFQTRSGAVTMMVNQYLSAQQLQAQMQVMVDAMKKLADGNNLTEDEAQQLLGLEQLVKRFPAK